MDTPKTEKETERFENERLKCAVSSMQGWRVEMEDALCVHNPVSTIGDAAAAGETDWTLGYRPAYRGTEPPAAFVALPVVAFRSN